MKAFRRRATIALLLATSLLVAGYAILGHDLIEAAYRGEDGAILSSWVDAEEESLAYFIERADLRLAWLLLMVWFFAGICWLPRRPVLVAGSLSVFAALTAVFIDSHPGWIRLVTSEPDGVLDVVTAPTFVFAGLVLLFAALRNRHGSGVLVAILLALLFLFCGGEEGSWLQKTIEYETPELVARHNLQNEFNLHNQFSTSAFNTLFLVGVAFLFCVVPLLGAGAGGDARLLRQFGFVFLVYFLLRSMHPHVGEGAFLTWFMRGVGVLMFGLVLGARLLVDSFFWRPVIWLRESLRFTPRLVTASSLLFGTWLLYGIRFRCLADLQFAGMSHGGNIDNELLELLVAMLALLLAWDQLPGVQEPGAEPTGSRIDSASPASRSQSTHSGARPRPRASSSR